LLFLPPSLVRLPAPSSPLLLPFFPGGRAFLEPELLELLLLLTPPAVVL